MNSAHTNRTDKAGKIFQVISREVRMCVTCQEFFTRQGAHEHALVSCMPASVTTLPTFDPNLLSPADC